MPITTRVMNSNPAHDILDTTLCDKIGQWVAACRWFYPGTPASSTNKTDRLLKVIIVDLYHKLNNKNKNCFWNNLHQVRSMPKRFKFQIILRYLGYQRCSQSHLRSYIIHVLLHAYPLTFSISVARLWPLQMHVLIHSFGFMW